jgi:hypothetical protein
MPPPAPLWVNAPRQLAVFESSPSAAPRLQAQNGDSGDMGQAAETAELAAFKSSPADTSTLQIADGDSGDMGQAAETAELAAFESSPADTSTLQIADGDSGDMGQASEMAQTEQPLADAPPPAGTPQPDAERI